MNITMSSARGICKIDMSKFKYYIIYEGYNYFKNEYETTVYKRTNNEKAAQKALKEMEIKCNKIYEDRMPPINPRLIKEG